MRLGMSSPPQAEPLPGASDQRFRSALTRRRSGLELLSADGNSTPRIRPAVALNESVQRLFPRLKLGATPRPPPPGVFNGGSKRTKSPSRPCTESPSQDIADAIDAAVGGDEIVSATGPAPDGRRRPWVCQIPVWIGLNGS